MIDSEPKNSGQTEGVETSSPRSSNQLHFPSEHSPEKDPFLKMVTLLPPNKDLIIDRLQLFYELYLEGAFPITELHNKVELLTLKTASGISVDCPVKISIRSKGSTARIRIGRPIAPKTYRFSLNGHEIFRQYVKKTRNHDIPLRAGRGVGILDRHNFFLDDDLAAAGFSRREAAEKTIELVLELIHELGRQIDRFCLDFVRKYGASTPTGYANGCESYHPMLPTIEFACDREVPSPYNLKTNEQVEGRFRRSIGTMKRIIAGKTTLNTEEAACDGFESSFRQEEEGIEGRNVLKLYLKYDEPQSPVWLWRWEYQLDGLKLSEKYPSYEALIRKAQRCAEEVITNAMVAEVPDMTELERLLFQMGYTEFLATKIARVLKANHGVIENWKRQGLRRYNLRRLIECGALVPMKRWYKGQRARAYKLIEGYKEKMLGFSASAGLRVAKRKPPKTHIHVALFHQNCAEQLSEVVRSLEDTAFMSDRPSMFSGARTLRTELGCPACGGLLPSRRRPNTILGSILGEQ